MCCVEKKLLIKNKKKQIKTKERKTKLMKFSVGYI